MTYTPVELRHVRVGRSLFGYNRATVEQLIEEVAQSFEVTWRERGELAERVEGLERQLEEHRRREHLLSQTLIAAEQAASDVRERARREADTIVSEAHVEARAISRQAHAERERLLSDAQRIKALLRSALGVITVGTDALQGDRPAARPPAGPERVVLPPVLDDPAPAPGSPAAGEETPPEAAVVLPPLLPDEPPAASPPHGWREDTREFEAIDVGQAKPPAEEQAEEQAEEPGEEHADAPPAAPVLQRIPGRESRDFDWGE
jgi:cell division initiation protein